MTTPIDAAHAALAAVMEAGRDDPALRMAFYGAVLAAELHILLEAEPKGEQVRPLIVETEEGPVVLAFDLAARMAAFLDAPADTLVVAGRSLVSMLAGRGIGVALNPDVAPSASVIEPDAVDWLAAEARAVEARSGRLGALGRPMDVPPALVRAVEARLAAYSGIVAAGYLVETEGEAGERRLLLALEGVPEAGEAAVAAAIDEAVRFSGAEGVGLDVIFPSEETLRRIARVAIAFRPEQPDLAPPAAPGSAPARPPRLR